MRSPINPSSRATYCCAFSVRILLKILIHKQKRAESPMVSLAQGNTLRKSAFWSKIIVKDYVVAAYLSDRLFLAIGHIFIKDFPQRFTCGLFCHDSA